MNFYLDRYAFREQLINVKVDPVLGLVIVIPCCNESQLNQSLKSLLNCELPSCSVEVIVVINASEIADEAILNQNETSFNEASEWVSQLSLIHI